MLRSELESYTIVKSFPCNQDHASLYVECHERECDADEETGKQNINLEVIPGDINHAPRGMLDVVCKACRPTSTCVCDKIARVVSADSRGEGQEIRASARLQEGYMI